MASITAVVLAIGELVPANVVGTGPASSSLSSASANGSASLPKSCAESLALNVEALKTAGIRYSVGRTYRVKGLSRPTHEEYYLYLDKGNCYQSREFTIPGAKGKSAHRHTEEMSFDGKVFFIGDRSRPHRNQVVKLLGENASDPRNSNIMLPSPYLDAVGFDLPKTPALWKNSGLASSVLFFTSTGKISRMETGGSTLYLNLRIPEPYVVLAKKRNLDIMSNESRDKRLVSAYRRVRQLDWYRQVELWLDLEKGCAVIRRKDSNPAGKLIQTVDCEDYRYTQKAMLWLPWKCIVKSYVRTPMLLDAFSDVPEETDLIEVQEVTLQPRADIAFTLDPDSGSVVTDYSTKAAAASPSGNVQYIVTAGPDELRNAAIATRARRYTSLIIIAANILLASLLFYYHFRQKARRPSGRTPP